MMFLGMHRHTGEGLSDMAHLRQSVSDILQTPTGSRVMRRDYGSTPLEVAAAAACAQLAQLPVPLRQLLNPQTCPVNLLPYLAWAFSVG